MEEDKQVVFDSELVRAFCQHTGDSNRFHDHVWAKERGKRAIVPGFIVFSGFVPLMGSQELLGRRIDLRFGKFLFAGDEVKLVFSQGAGAYSLRVLGAGKEGVYEDHFMQAGQGSTLSLERVPVSSPENYSNQREVSLETDLPAVEFFQHELGIRDSRVAGLFYSFSKLSGALFKMLDASASKTERDLAGKVAEGNVLAYKSLSIFPLNYPLFSDASNFDFDIFYNPGKDREQGAFVSCRQEGREVYMADLNLVILPEKVIVRAMKNV